MTYLQALVLSIIEGITEFLPISSTGHLILASKILEIPGSEFLKSFEIIIQLGAILAVFVLYFRSIFFKRKIFKRVAVAFIPSAVLGLLFYKFIKDFLLESAFITTIALFVGGIILIFFEYWHRGRKKPFENIENLNFSQAFFIGIFQSLALVPGVSRSGATILGGMLFGFSRKIAVEFSFLLAIPTMLAASGLDLIKTQFRFSAHEYLFLGIGLIGAYITAWITVKFFLRFIEKHTFIPFGIYRIFVAIAFWIFVL